MENSYLAERKSGLPLLGVSLAGAFIALSGKDSKEMNEKQGKRILILGGPRGGKTTHARDLSRRLGIPVQHFDNYISRHEWSELSDKIAEWLDESGPWIKEGVAGARGLRKWLRKNKRSPPFEIIVLNEPRINLTSGQKNMHKSHSRILEECLAEIESRKRKGM